MLDISIEWNAVQKVKNNFYKQLYKNINKP